MTPLYRPALALLPKQMRTEKTKLLHIFVCLYQTPSTYYNTYIIYQCRPSQNHPIIIWNCKSMYNKIVSNFLYTQLLIHYITTRNHCWIISASFFIHTLTFLIFNLAQFSIKLIHKIMLYADIQFQPTAEYHHIPITTSFETYNPIILISKTAAYISSIHCA